MWVPIRDEDADAGKAEWVLENFEHEDSTEPRWTLCVFDPQECTATPMLFTFPRAMRLADLMNAQEQEIIDYHTKKGNQ